MNEMPDDLEPAILVIFGITGDLSQRYLLPALYNLISQGRLHPKTQIVGVTRGDTTVGELYSRVELCINDSGDNCEPEVLAKLQSHTEMFKMDLDDPNGYANLLVRLNELEEEIGSCTNRLYYLSIPPKAYADVIRLLGEQGLNNSCHHGKASTRLMVEKPFGSNLQTGQALIQETASYFSEEQTFRIDHYMAKPAVQAILKSRYDNKDREATWNASNISSIIISAKEKIDIEGRSIFYESLGALRDFIQSHLVQVLGIVTMDMPDSLDSQSIHDAKETVLSQASSANSVTKAVRGQYTGYREEVKNQHSSTETYASVDVDIDNPRWQGVTLTLITGKALDERKAEVKITYKDGSEFIFPIQPEPGLQTAKSPNAYERVFADAISGDHTVFSTSEEVISSWRILQPVIDAWESKTDDLLFYEKGTPGPC